MRVQRVTHKIRKLHRTDHEASPSPSILWTRCSPPTGGGGSPCGLSLPGRERESPSLGTNDLGSSTLTVTRKTSSVRVLTFAEVVKAPPMIGTLERPGTPLLSPAVVS